MSQYKSEAFHEQLDAAALALDSSPPLKTVLHNIARNYMMYPVISCLCYVTKWPTLLQNARRFAQGRRLIEQMTYSRVDVRKKIFPSSHTTISISDETVRGRDLPRAGFDGYLRCAAGGIVLLI
jgi:hypothetical protein